MDSKEPSRAGQEAAAGLAKVRDRLVSFDTALGIGITVVSKMILIKLACWGWTSSTVLIPIKVGRGTRGCKMTEGTKDGVPFHLVHVGHEEHTRTVNKDISRTSVRRTFGDGVLSLHSFKARRSIRSSNLSFGQKSM